METTYSRTELIAQIRQFPQQVEALVAPLTDVQLTTQTPVEAWDIAQIVHHLADSHMNAFIRLKLLLTEDHPTLKPYDQDAWAQMVDETTPDLTASLTILRGLHTRWAIVFAALTTADWQRTAHHPEIGTVTAADILESYAQHCRDHLAQMERVLQAQTS